MLTWLTETIDSRPLGLARLVVGIAALIRGLSSWEVLTQLSRVETLRVPYLDWIPQPNLPLAVGIVAVWLIAAALFVLGYRVAITGTCLLITILLTLALDQQTYSNHMYLMAWLVALLTLADAGAGVNASRTDRRVVRWPVLLLMMQTSIVYGFSALTKINSDFVSGRVLAASLRGGVIEFPEALRTPRFLSALALVVIAVELFIAIFLWRARLRPFAFLFGLGLHVSITLLMGPTLQLLVFSLEMMALYPLFLSGRLEIVAPPSSTWVDRARSFDLLGVIDFEGDPAVASLTLAHHGITSRGAAAHTRVLEHLVPWLWVAPVLRLPVISHLHRLRHRAEPAQEAARI